MSHASHRLSLLAGCLLAVAGCTGQPLPAGEVDDPVVAADELTFEEFKASLPYDQSSDTYTIEEDTHVHDDALLRSYYDKVAEQATALAITSDSTTHWNWGNTNVLSRYSDSRKLNLTYCITSEFSAADRALVSSGFASAAANWENIANVNFIDKTPTGGCAVGETSVFFDIRKHDPLDQSGLAGHPICDYSDCHMMASFFPFETSRSKRYIELERDAYHAGIDVGQATHELGHSLGFIHEHQRRVGCTAGDQNSTYLTPYDELSVMHYYTSDPTAVCARIGNLGYNISTEDIRGVQCIYNEAADTSYCMHLAGSSGGKPLNNTITASGNGIYGVNASGYVVQWLNYGWSRLAATDTKTFKTTIGGANKWFGVGTDNSVYRWDIGTTAWIKVGSAGAQFIVTYDDQLFALAPAKNAVNRWSGSGTTWYAAGGAFSQLIAGNNTAYALDSVGNVWRWGTGTSWTKIGTPGMKFAADGFNKLYAITPDGSQVVRYTSSTGWQVIGTASKDLWSGPGVNGVYSKGTDGLVYRYNGTSWTLVTRRKAASYVLNYAVPTGYATSPRFSILVEKDTNLVYRYVEL